MNTPVNFEIAKLLKEKGFDKITESLWHFNGSECIKMINKNSENFGFSAPTIAEVVMWLYEKHGIWITVCVIGADGFGYWLHNKNRKRLNTEDQGGYWYSPTEAYEAAIEYTLNNLL